MNANEVMANIALELTGHELGEYDIINPLDDLNMSQSTNDSYPTAIKVAIIRLNEGLSEQAELLAGAFRAKGDEFLNILKMGRTEMQDAVPMTVGQEFHAFAAVLEGNIAALHEAERHLYGINMGGTAIGTGLNPIMGHEKGDQLAKEAYESDKGILELIREKKILTDEQLRELLAPEALTGLNPENYK